jgi:diguanylate cyclase (GGDEF)-like protein
MMIDLDGFKGVNDTLGHDIGDKLLVLVSGILQRCAPKGAMVARLGGDEFAILLGNVSTDNAKKIGEGMISAFGEEAKAIFANKGDCPPASLSIGVAARTPQDKGPATELLKRADQALYQAKSAGKSRVEVFQPDEELERARLAAAASSGDRRKPR